MPRIIGSAMVSVTVDDSAGTAHDIKGEVIDISDDESRNLLDTTTVSHVEMQRTFGLHDTSLSLNCFLNTDTGSTYDIFLANQTNKRKVKLGFATNLFWNGVMLIESVSLSRGTDTNLTLDISLQQAEGVTSVWTTS